MQVDAISDGFLYEPFWHVSHNTTIEASAQAERPG